MRYLLVVAAYLLLHFKYHILAHGSDFTGQRATVWHASHGSRATVITFLVPAYLGCPGKEAIKRVSVCLSSQKIYIRRYRAMHFSAKRGIAIVVMSVCPSVCLLRSCITFVHCD